MNNETLHIDDLLSNSFAGFEPAMPALAWEGIAAKLDKNSKKGGFAWLKAAAVVLIVAGAWYSLSHVLNHRNNGNNNSAVKVENTIKAESKSEKASGTENGENLNSKQNSNLGVSENSQENSTSHSPDLPVNRSQSPSVQKQNNDHLPQTPKETVADGSQNSYRQIVENNRERIRKSKIEDANWNQFLAEVAESAKNSKSLTPPVRPLLTFNDRFSMGIGVGQAVSNTGYSINNEFKDYVHPYFKKEIEKGEGILSALNFNAAVYYKLGKESRLSVYSGISYFQRKTSLDFNFSNYTGFEDGLKPLDKFGNKAYFSNWDPKANGTAIGTVEYKGINTFTQVEIPLGIMYDVAFGYKQKWSFMPAISTNVGFITQKIGKTLDYHTLEVTKIDPTWFRTTYFSLNSSLGIYKNLSNSMKIGVNVSGSYMLTPMYVPGATIRPRALTGGLSTQLIWRLTK